MHQSKLRACHYKVTFDEALCIIWISGSNSFFDWWIKVNLALESVLNMN
jgi:hypothetical protein